MSGRKRQSVLPDFRRAAKARLEAAKYLLRGGFRPDAMYLAGYAVECILKAWLVQATPFASRATLHGYFKGTKGHDYEFLREKLVKSKALQRREQIPEFFRVKGWETSLRYGVGHYPAQDVENFMAGSRKIVEWVDKRLK